ncbi:MAG TPA: M28 family peptidase [Thermoanaerobaculia bacterium]|nr:M28 family peptidase [Thermoanaerobaculia bacterium]
MALLFPVLARPAAAPPVQPARLAAHVRMLTEDFVPRDEAHPENLDRAASYIRQVFESTGGRVEEQPFQVRGRTYRNVIAHFGPQTRERIVVGAHYDAAGPLPGADDNASGVAGVLELAHLLGRTAPPAHVELVAYTLEEPPYFAGPMMGSVFHAASLKKQGVKVRAMICLEMIGYFTDEPRSQRFPHPSLRLLYPSTGNFIAVVGRIGQGSLAGRIKKSMKRSAPLPVHSINAPRWLPGVDFSDHRSYWEAGWDAVMITDTAFYRNDNYHTAADTADTLDYGRMALVVQGLDAAVRAEAGRIRR